MITTNDFNHQKRLHILLNLQNSSGSFGYVVTSKQCPPPLRHAIVLNGWSLSTRPGQQNSRRKSYPKVLQLKELNALIKSSLHQLSR